MAPARTVQDGDDSMPTHEQPSSWAVQRSGVPTAHASLSCSQRTAEGHLAVALAKVHVAHAELAALDKDRQVHLQP